MPVEDSGSANPHAVLEDSMGNPSVARVYDWYLNGGHHWEVDRQLGKRVESILPDVKMYALENRRFLQRAVAHFARQGVTQFVDIGSGLPSRGNVHEIAEHHLPGQARVVYIDKEPVACAHGTLILEQTGDPTRHQALEANLLEPEQLWQRVLDTGVINPERPIALLIVAVLHFVKDTADPDAAVAYLRDRLPPGSFIALSHFTGDDCVTDEEVQAHNTLVEFYERSSDPGQLRSRDEFTRFFGGLPLIDPGIVYTPQWRPDPSSAAIDRPSAARILAGAAQVR